ncbi:MAG: hypothetical protein M1814_002508 [Vezdaea aestivalis]|nr:MAG: hypothetical protein M1814_002508 [Vezdaea aestivalis]
MPAESSAAAPRLRSRKSIAAMPSSGNPAGFLDQENLTMDIGAASRAAKAVGSKKQRSKSIGPGGLDALSEHAGNRQKVAITPVVRSILKPTIPLSPLREIPSRRITVDNASPSRNTRRQGDQKRATNNQDTENLTPENTSPSRAGPAKVSLRTEEEQQAAAREREALEQREDAKRQAIERRDARRKSLANRRVSFAPEATLHTWDVVEYFQDSTSSSSGTNATRRASGTASSSPKGRRESFSATNIPDRPETPPEQAEVDERDVPLPEHQRDLHQKKRRRSSTVPPVRISDQDGLQSSPYSGSSALGSDDGPIDPDDIDPDSNESSSNSGDEENVTMDMVSADEDDDETSNNTIMSSRSMGSDGSSSGRLDAALRNAALQAGIQGVEMEDNLDMSMDLDQVDSPAATPVAAHKFSAQDLTSVYDQENQNPFRPTPNPSNPLPADTTEADLSMDMTHAIGGILAPNDRSTRKRQSLSSERRQSIRRMSEDGSTLEDASMDLTMAIGGIQEPSDGPDANEELTMEFTTVFGGMLPSREAVQAANGNYARQDIETEEADEPEELEMEMTTAVGGILPSQALSTIDEETSRMDIPTAIGGLLPRQWSSGSRSHAKALMEQEADQGEPASSPFQEQVSPHRPDPSPRRITRASTGSSPSFRRSTHSSRASLVSSPAKGVLVARTPERKAPGTPLKQITPIPPRPTTPGKTPPSSAITMRTASPKRLFKKELRSRGSTPKSTTPKTLDNKTIQTVTPKQLFTQDTKTGTSTPFVVLTPNRRRSSGLGIDRSGLGSPRLAALLDRRRSIGDDAASFTPQRPSSRLRFEDPQALQLEVEEELAAIERRESGKLAMEAEADSQTLPEKEVTLNIREMIQHLSPKKKVAGRKSLHVGAARGILGKRPAELDQEDEGESPKRLKGREGSPVKSVTLGPPPSKAETSGRMLRARKSLGVTAGNAQVLLTPKTPGSPGKSASVTTPRSQGRFRDVETVLGVQEDQPHFDATIEPKEVEMAEVEEELDDAEPIHLQDFLNMTSIRFMELNTTKRRHTIAPPEECQKVERADESNPFGESASFMEKCVVAGACTVPMLELYQHSCRELKKYISEGRRIVREIETDTLEENPPLFKEYISASPDVKFIMDNQFKNVKTYSRLQSKAMWYEWRMKLLEGLRVGLVKIEKGMEDDGLLLEKREALLAPLVPGLVEQHEKLEKEHQILQGQADEVAGCDQDQLTAARDELVAVEKEIAARTQKVKETTSQIAAREADLVDARKRKQTCLADTEAAEKIREKCRGWSNSEVKALKARVEAIEKEHGWTISGADSGRLIMAYRGDLQLVFEPSHFLSSMLKSGNIPTSNGPISISYIGDTLKHQPRAFTTEKRFILQHLQARLQGLHQASTKPKSLLTIISRTWDAAAALTEDVRLLNLAVPTQSSITSDDSLEIKSTLILPSLKSKVRIAVRLTAISESLALGLRAEYDAKVVYGEAFHENKMSEFLACRGFEKLDAREQAQRGKWMLAVRELEERLIIRGRK